MDEEGSTLYRGRDPLVVILQSCEVLRRDPQYHVPGILAGSCVPAAGETGGRCAVLRTLDAP